MDTPSRVKIMKNREPKESFKFASPDTAFRKYGIIIFILE